MRRGQTAGSIDKFRSSSAQAVSSRRGVECGPGQHHPVRAHAVRTTPWSALDPPWRAAASAWSRIARPPDDPIGPAPAPPGRRDHRRAGRSGEPGDELRQGRRRATLQQRDHPQPAHDRRAGVVPVAGRREVPGGIQNQAVLVEPTRRRLMQLGDHLRMAAPQFRPQYLREQRVVPKPLRLLVDQSLPAGSTGSACPASGRRRHARSAHQPMTGKAVRRCWSGAGTPARPRLWMFSTSSTR